MKPLARGKLSPTRIFLIVLGGIAIAYLFVDQLEHPPEEGWLVECPTNLDIIAAAQGERLARGEGYIPCAGWPELTPEGSHRWDRTDRRCCAQCNGTWESLCDLQLAEDPEQAQACWSSCAERHINKPDGDGSGDWPHLCCSECGAARASRCTVASGRDSEDVDKCFRACEAETPIDEPPACWWSLGFEPGVALRGRYEVTLSPESFTARCSIRRASGEVLDFEVLGRIASPEGD